jgi:hypothetical protein
MTGNLRSRIERIERLERQHPLGGLFIVITVFGDGPLAEPKRSGGITVLHMRPDEAKAFCEGERTDD